MRDVKRISLALGIVALATIFGLAGLAQLKFSAFLSDSVGERLNIVAVTAAQDFGAALDLGLQVENVANGQEILERARAHDPEIGAIAIFGLDGTILHHVGDLAGAELHDRTVEAFQLAQLDEATADWTVDADERIRSGTIVRNSFGQPVAGVVVHYPTTDIREQESDIGGSLLLSATAISLVVVLVVGLAYLLLRHEAGGVLRGAQSDEEAA